LNRRHDFANAHRTSEYALPRAVRYSKRRTREKDRCWRPISSEQLCKLVVSVAAEDRLVKYDQVHRTTIRLVGVNTERRAQRARSYRVIANFAERGAQKSARPLLRHNKQYPRRKRRLR
jgi:hypothetical protein